MAKRFVYDATAEAVRDQAHADQAVTFGWFHIPRPRRSAVVDAAGEACAQALNAALAAAAAGQALSAPMADSRYTIQRGRYGNVRIQEDCLPVAWIARRDKSAQGEIAALRMAEVCAQALNNLQL